jgi:hypothetical protein
MMRGGGPPALGLVRPNVWARHSFSHEAQTDHSGPLGRRGHPAGRPLAAPATSAADMLAHPHPHTYTNKSPGARCRHKPDN